MLVFGKFCLTTEQDSIVNYRTGYFSTKISSQKGCSCKKIKYVPICTDKKNSSNMLTVICVHLGVVIRERGNRDTVKSEDHSIPAFTQQLIHPITPNFY